MIRSGLITVVLFSINALTGCATLEVPYDPPGHAGGWDPMFGSCDTCGTCGGVCEGHTPASYIGHQLRCTSGCGEIYWGLGTTVLPIDAIHVMTAVNLLATAAANQSCARKIWWKITGYDGSATLGKGCSSCGSKGCSSCDGKGCSSCGSAVSDVPYYEYEESTVAPNEAATPELPPATPPPPASERETPAFIRPAQGVSLSLPFKLHSTRVSR